MTTVLRVLGQTLLQGFAEIRAAYTVKTWCAAWLLRMLTQVLFFALIGRMVGTDQDVRYLVVGNAVVLVALESLGVITSTVAERNQGTFVLLAASPVSVANVYMARGLQWVCTGTVTATVALVFLPSLFGSQVQWARLPATIPMIILIGLSSYAYGCLMATIVLRNIHVQWLVLNIGYLALTTFCGVNVPTTYWPQWLGIVTAFLPVTHGLSAVRSWMDGAVDDVAWQLFAEAAVGVGWFLLALLAHQSFLRRSRAEGTLDFV